MSVNSSDLRLEDSCSAESKSLSTISVMVMLRMRRMRRMVMMMVMMLSYYLISLESTPWSQKRLTQHSDRRKKQLHNNTGTAVPIRKGKVTTARTAAFHQVSLENQTLSRKGFFKA